jgi:hypothetical protein
VSAETTNPITNSTTNAMPAIMRKRAVTAARSWPPVVVCAETMRAHRLGESDDPQS